MRIEQGKKTTSANYSLLSLEEYMHHNQLSDLQMCWSDNEGSRFVRVRIQIHLHAFYGI